MSKTIKMFPAVGWVRANAVASEDVLADINELRKENTSLRSKLAELTSSKPVELKNLAGLDEPFTVHGRYYDDYYKRFKDWTVNTTWHETFSLIGPYLVKFPNDDYVKSILTTAFTKKAGVGGSSKSIDDQDFQTISVQLRALGLINTKYSQTTAGGMALFWSLTPNGERQMLEARTIKSKNDA